MNKKIAVIGTVGLPATYGGFETLTQYLTKELNQELDFTVYCSSQTYKEQLPSFNNATLRYINLNANGIQSIPYDMLSILNALKFADTLLILGVSGCLILPFIKLFSKKRLVVNIDGLEWKRQKWNGFAKWFLKFSERLAVKYADKLVTDNKVIQDYVTATYNKPSHLIAYGGDHATKEVLSAETLKRYPYLNTPYAFKVCRIEPENNIEMILRAFSKSPNIPLVLIGNWQKSEFGQKMKSTYAGTDHIHMLDPIYDQKILNEIRSNCYVYIHGHSAGGTNPSLVEAMHLSLPILAYSIHYNRETTKNSALYFESSQDLASLITALNPERLKQNALAMKTIADDCYTWKSIAQNYRSII